MKISTKLQGSAVLIIGIVVIFVGAVLYVSVKVGQAGERNQIAERLLETSATGAALRVEYGLTGEERPKVQWYALQATLNSILDQSASVFNKPVNQTLFVAIKENQDRKRVTFDAVVIAKERGDNPELTARLDTQLAVTVQEGVSIATRLAELSREELSVSQQLLKTIVGVLGLLAILFALISYFVSRKISSSLATLQQEFVRIASLDFSSTTTTTTTTTGKDELGMLSRAFDTMVVKLKESYATLEKKVRDRTQDLEEAKTQDEAILSSIGDAVMACDKDGQVILFNNAAEELTGFSAKEAIGSHYNQVLKFVRESDGKAGNDFIGEAIKTAQGTNMTNHTLLITKDGRQTSVADSASPVQNTQGEVIGCVVVFRDVTEERKVDQAKSEFVSLASHQLRTPLSTISWYTEMLLSEDVGALTPKQKSYLNEIYGGNRRMVELVNSLLNVARIETESFGIEPQLVSIKEIVDSVLKDLTADIKAKKLRVETAYDDVKSINADPKLLRLIFQNLLANAVQYTLDNGSIKLTADRLASDIQFTVTDTGIGIPQAQQEKIFTKLFRADNARIQSPNGSGLGLYMVKSILDHAGGKIWFESKENKGLPSGRQGTTFYFTLPLSGMPKKEGDKRLV